MIDEFYKSQNVLNGLELDTVYFTLSSFSIFQTILLFLQHS